MSIFHALVDLASVSAFKFINPNNTLFQSFWVSFWGETPIHGALHLVIFKLK